MKRNLCLIIPLAAALLAAGCNVDQPTRAEERAAARQQKWDERLALYEDQIDAVKAEVDGVDDFSQLFGSGAGQVEGDGTFIGEGVGTATLTGVGIVTGEVTGIVNVRGTVEVSVAGLQYVGNKEGYESYSGAGWFTVTSDVGQQIEVVAEGDCWVVGAGTGMAFWSGEGWVFWYR